ncbi:MAG: class I SAM-dependent methyltransferase [Planctomycetota bacterium]
MNAQTMHQQIQHARDYFGADYYGRPRFAKFLPYFQQPGTILDYGCNEGVFLHLLREHGRDGLGIDYDLKNIERCRQFGLAADHADIFAFTADPANHNQYAGIMMADFVEHFDPYPLQQLLEQSVHLLKPGGTMVIVTPNSRSIHMATGGFYEFTIEHHNPYSVFGLRQYLEKHGMEWVASDVDDDTRTPVFTPHPTRFARNIGIWILGRILCGKGCMHETTYLIMRKGDGADSGRFARSPQR